MSQVNANVAEFRIMYENRGKASGMLDALIVEPDFIISLDIAEAVRVADPSARVRTVETIEEASNHCYAGERLTHAFVRMLSTTEQRVAAGLVTGLARSGTSVVLLGAESVPRSLLLRGSVSCLPFPFSWQQIADHLISVPHRPRAA